MTVKVAPETKQHIKDLNARYHRLADLGDDLLTAVRAYMVVQPPSPRYAKERRALKDACDNYERG